MDRLEALPQGARETRGIPPRTVEQPDGGADSFRHRRTVSGKGTAWNPFGIRLEGEAARRVVEDGNDFGAANKKKLDELLWRKLRELKDGDEIDGKLHDLVLSSARLTAQVRANRESEGKLKLLEAKLAELAREKAEWERKEKEREEAKKKAIADIRNGGGLSDEALAKLEAQIGSL